MLIELSGVRKTYRTGKLEYPALKGVDLAIAEGDIRYVLIALLGTVVLALLIMLAPLRRAARFKPGEAIRYA